MKQRMRYWWCIVPVCLIIGFVFSVVGTPWGYFRFYFATLAYNNAYFDSSVKVASLGYTFDGSGYYAECYLKDEPGNLFLVKETGRDGLLVNSYFKNLWTNELEQYFCSGYPEFSFSFDIPFLYSKYPVFDNRASIPSVFKCTYADDYLNDIQITVPKTMNLTEMDNAMRLYSIVQKVIESFPDVHITIRYSEKLITIHEENRLFVDSIDVFAKM